MYLLMAMIVVMGEPWREGHSCRHPGDGRHRIGFTGNEHSDAVSAQTLHQPLTRTLGY